ncbi:tpsA, partial [Symbiodinium sp. KB8]
MGGECNSAFGAIGHLPFHFLYQDLNRVDVTALMVKAHVFMDTPLRDTLSREAHEFVWCQEEPDCGVLILSEFSGSAQSLRAAAICVNPWDTTAFADAIQE